MEYTTSIPEYRVRLTPEAIADLLGITPEEYAVLNHKPLESFTNSEGEITEFYIHISSNNDPGLLAKLSYDNSNFVRFSPEDVYRRYS